MAKRKRDHPLQIRPVPIPADAHHPNVPHPEILPQHEFTFGLIAPKGSGKTTVIANLLDFYAGYFHTITIISPTIHSDEKWDYVRKRPLLGENKALKKFLEKHAGDKQSNPVVESLRAVESKRESEFDPKIPDEQFIVEYDEADFLAMMDEQLGMIEKIKKLGGTKYLANRWLIICDDMVGSSMFSGARKNPFKKANTNHRHYSASILEVSQGYKEIQKTLRTNWTGLITFEIPNEAEVKVLYEEHPVGMKRETWQQVYDYCTGDEYSFLYINYKRPKKMRCMKNFDEFVFMGNDDDEKGSNM